MKNIYKQCISIHSAVLQNEWFVAMPILQCDMHSVKSQQYIRLLLSHQVGYTMADIQQSERAEK